MDIPSIVLDRQIGNKKVGTRKQPIPAAFAATLISWAASASYSIFEPRPDRATKFGDKDSFSLMAPVLGPWDENDIEKHRRAALVELMLVLAGRESSWNWQESLDKSNAKEDTIEEMSAGAWQVSADSKGFGQELKDCIWRHLRTYDARAFRKAMMDPAGHLFAMEYTARLLRLTHRHHGPLRRFPADIQPFLSVASVKAIRALL